MSDSVQIFVSYARVDDSKPADAGDAPGFVAHLHDQLNYEFVKNGAPQPVLWRDVKRIADADPFDPDIQAAVEASSIFLVVLSKNWLAREYCRRELDMFADRWRHEDPLALRRRIVIVRKREVDLDRLPSLLQGQTGTAFFAHDKSDVLENIEDFYDPGRTRDNRFFEQMKKVAAFLLRSASRLGGETIPSPPPEPVQPGPRNGRVVYVAQAANDLRDARKRIVEELVGRGYEVVPDPAVEFPVDASATAFIDSNLQRAEIAVHLLGTKVGYTPEDAPAAIVPLQLARAALRCGQDCGVADTGFRRIVWAPKSFGMIGEKLGEETERDPLAVLEKLHQRLPTDKIMGDNPSAFVDNLLNYLLLNPPRRPEARSGSGAPNKSTRIYLNHAKGDFDYAVAVAKALRKRQIVAFLAATDGDAADVDAFNRKHLQTCDTVALCWARAPSVSVRALASEFEDFTTFGRTQDFAVKAIVAGPPPNGHKKNLEFLFAPSEIGSWLDLSEYPEPPPDKLDPLLGDVEIPAA